VNPFVRGLDPLGYDCIMDILDNDSSTATAPAPRAKTAPKKSRHPKTDELRALMAMAKDKDKAMLRPKSVPLPGSIEAVHAAFPFLPSSGRPDLFGHAAPYLSNVVTKEDSLARSRAIEEEAKAAAANKAALLQLPVMRDAETGEPLELTKAVWSTTEGRINLSTALDIVSMGTGQHTITPLPPLALAMTAGDSPNNKSAKGNGFENPFSPPSSPSKSVRFGAVDTKQFFASSPGKSSRLNSPTTSLQHTALPTAAAALPSSPGSALGSARAALTSRSLDHYAVRHPRRHPLVSKFLKEGPLNITGHRFWGVKSNSVAVPARYAETVRDDDYESEDDGGDDGDDGDLSVDDSIAGSAQDSLLTTDEDFEHLVKQQLSARRKKSSNGSKGGGDENKTPTERLLDNALHWKATEESTFRSLYQHAKAHEKNKSLTGEKRHPGGMSELKKACRKIAKMKVDCFKTLAYHIAEEEKKEVERQQEVDDCDPKKLRYLLRDHDEQRHQKRVFFRVAQYDNEIAIARAMSDLNLLW